VKRKRGRPPKAADGAVAEETISIRLTKRELDEFVRLRKKVNWTRFGEGEADLNQTETLKSIIRDALTSPLVVTLPSPEAELLTAMAKQEVTTESEVACDLIMLVIRKEAARRNIVPVLDEGTGATEYVDVTDIDSRGRTAPREGDQPRAKDSAPKGTRAPTGVAKKRTTKGRKREP
jgi:hypothetical protein